MQIYTTSAPCLCVSVVNSFRFYPQIIQKTHIKKDFSWKYRKVIEDMKIIDSHSHVFFSPHLGVEPDPDGKRLIEELDACNIESAVVSAVDSLCTTELKKQKK